MQKMFFSFALLCFATVAFSAPFAPVFLEREISGGFVPQEMIGWGAKVSLHTNGDVILGFKANAQGPWHYKTVAVLTVDSINNLQAVINILVPGELTTPDDPKCTDAPSVVYSAVKGGTKIIFAQETDCVLGYLESFFHSYELQGILDGFALFSDLDLASR